MIVSGLSDFLLALGALATLLGAWGLLRLPDFYTRTHAASLTDAGAAALTLIGLMLLSGLSLITVKLVFILIFLLFTSPTAAHALARAALSDGHRPQLGRPPR